MATALLAAADLATASPFTGGQSGAKHILRDDGSMSIKMEPKLAQKNKYSHMVS